jgi:hypothetical protein
MIYFAFRKVLKMKIETEFKEAILAMPEKEKDKLLIRLIKKDKVLVNQLYFQLLETKSVEAFRTELEDRFQRIVAAVKSRFYSSDIFLQEVSRSPSWNVYWIPTIANTNDVCFNTSLCQQGLHTAIKFCRASSHGQNYAANFRTQRNRLEFKIATM